MFRELSYETKNNIPRYKVTRAWRILLTLGRKLPTKLVPACIRCYQHNHYKDAKETN